MSCLEIPVDCDPEDLIKYGVKMAKGKRLCREGDKVIIVMGDFGRDNSD